MSDVIRFPGAGASLEATGEALRQRIHALFGRSLHVREIAAGSCNGCEVEVGQLFSPAYDVQRYGIDFVASPRHADALLVTGCVSRSMHPALRDVYDHTPNPKLVIACGACAISGGLLGGGYAGGHGVDEVIPVDVYIPGCPPSPAALLHGLLVAIGRAEPRLATRR